MMLWERAMDNLDRMEAGLMIEPPDGSSCLGGFVFVGGRKFECSIWEVTGSRTWAGESRVETQEENMKFYFIGNDKIPTDHHLFHKAWMEDGYAYTSGDDRYLKALKRLKKEDYIFCYVGGLGLAAIGKVINECDGRKYKDPLYEGRIEQGNVYKIKVNWLYDLTNSVIPHNKLAECGSFSVTQTLQEIRNEMTATKILKLVEAR